MKTENPNQKEIDMLRNSYIETERKIRGGTLPRHVTNIGDVQWMKLKRIRELGSSWHPSSRSIG
jgi:hypothetical protein